MLSYEPSSNSLDPDGRPVLLGYRMACLQFYQELFLCQSLNIFVVHSDAKIF